MFKASHTSLVVLSGLVWLAVGSFLLPLGLNFVTASILKENAALNKPLIDFLSPFIGGVDPAALTLIVLALILGYVKGRFIFGKTVNKGVARILSLPNPSHIKNIYTRKYYILLASMILIGFIVRFTTLDIRGFIDVAIGAALIHGAILYFRSAIRIYYRKENKVPSHL